MLQLSKVPPLRCTPVFGTSVELGICLSPFCSTTHLAHFSPQKSRSSQSVSQSGGAGERFLNGECCCWWRDTLVFNRLVSMLGGT